jgi:hypothetical protein
MEREMKKAAYAFALATLLVSGFANAATVQVVTQCGRKLPAATHDEYDIDALSVLKLTEKALHKAEATYPAQKADFSLKASDRGEVLTIGGVGQKRECTAAGIKAWGWNGALDGSDLVKAPSETFGLAPESKVQWTYVYVMMKLPEGKTCADADAVDSADECVQDDCAAVTASATDCPAESK